MCIELHSSETSFRVTDDKWTTHRDCCIAETSYMFLTLCSSDVDRKILDQIEPVCP